MIRLLLATRNAHKTREFAEILGDKFAVEDLRVHRAIAETEENGASFLENAQIKALTVSRLVPGLVLADDSGLEIDSLGGAPGIFSARYSGASATDEANRRKLLAELDDKPDRHARFVCVLVLAKQGNLLGHACGEVRGEIVRAERGAAGFGYDALFQPDGWMQTFAELSANEKNQLSHRAQAGAQIRRLLEEKFA